MIQAQEIIYFGRTDRDNAERYRMALEAISNLYKSSYDQSIEMKQIADIALSGAKNAKT